MSLCITHRLIYYCIWRNYSTLYEWLSGEVGFGSSDSLFAVLSWIYLLTLVAAVIFEVLQKYDFMQLCIYIGFGAMVVIFAVGLVSECASGGGALCIGMLLVSASFLCYRSSASSAYTLASHIP